MFFFLKHGVVTWLYSLHRLTHTKYDWAKIPVMDEISFHTQYRIDVVSKSKEW